MPGGHGFSLLIVGATAGLCAHPQCLYRDGLKGVGRSVAGMLLGDSWMEPSATSWTDPQERKGHQRD